MDNKKFITNATKSNKLNKVLKREKLHKEFKKTLYLKEACSPVFFCNGTDRNHPCKNQMNRSKFTPPFKIPAMIISSGGVSFQHKIPTSMLSND